MFRLVLLVVLVALLATGCVSTSGTRLGDDTTQSVSPGCVQDTGTRIRSKGSDCSTPGRIYSRADIERTGAFTTAEALQRLDPAITVSR